MTDVMFINTDLNSSFHLFLSIQEAVKTERRTNEGTFLRLMNLFLALFWKEMLNRTDNEFVGQTVDILLRQNFSVTDGVT